MTYLRAALSIHKYSCKNDMQVFGTKTKCNLYTAKIIENDRVGIGLLFAEFSDFHFATVERVRV